MLESILVQALAVAFFGGLVSVLWQRSEAGENIGAERSVAIVLSACFVGLLTALIVSSFSGASAELILSSAGLGALAGYPSIMRIKNVALEGITAKIRRTFGVAVVITKKYTGPNRRVGAERRAPDAIGSTGGRREGDVQPRPTAETPDARD